MIEFNLPAGTHQAAVITLGPDGNMWFTDKTGNAIGRITPAGAIKEFALPTHGAGPQGIVAGPDGNLWFTEMSAVPSKIGKITTSGVIKEFALPRGLTATCMLVSQALANSRARQPLV